MGENKGMMKKESIQVNLSREDLTYIISRYHFKDADFSDLEHLYRAVQPLVCPKMYYAINPELPFVEYDNCVIAIVTLGKHVDSLENLYSEAGCVLEGYMLDCLCMELLNKAYQSVGTILQEACGLWIDAYDFIGDKYPIEKIQEILDYSGQTEVIGNSAFMLQPKKSVIFIAKLVETRGKENCVICSQCNNMTCPNRDREERFPKRKEAENKLSYGYQRIFGK